MSARDDYPLIDDRTAGLYDAMCDEIDKLRAMIEVLQHPPAPEEVLIEHPLPE